MRHCCLVALPPAVTVYGPPASVVIVRVAFLSLAGASGAQATPTVQFVAASSIQPSLAGVHCSEYAELPLVRASVSAMPSHKR